MYLPEPTPQAEAARLAAVHRTGLLDTHAERIFDDFARLAAIVTGMPMALVSLIDAERQWYKARHGFDGTQIDRSNTVCNQTIRQYGLYEIPDLSSDKRFSQRNFVKDDPHLRYYAGVPLTDGQGNNIGAVCVMDTIVRKQMNGDVALALAIISRQVMELIEIRTQFRELTEKAEGLRGKQSAN